MDEPRRVCVSSTAWRHIDIQVIHNHSSEINISPAKWDEKEGCYTSELHVALTSDSAEELRELLNHIESGCQSNCRFCEMEED